MRGTAHRNAIQYNVGQYIAVQCNIGQCSAVYSNKGWCSAVQCSAVPCSALLCARPTCELRSNMRSGLVESLSQTLTIHSEAHVMKMLGMNVFHWMLYTGVLWACTAHCTLHTAHYTLHTARCTLQTAHCTLYRVGVEVSRGILGRTKVDHSFVRPHLCQHRHPHPHHHHPHHPQHHHHHHQHPYHH